MTQTESARALKISQAMVSKLASAGMPTASGAEAQEWRKRNLDPRLVRRRRRAPRSGNGKASAPDDRLRQIGVIATTGRGRCWPSGNWRYLRGGSWTRGGSGGLAEAGCQHADAAAGAPDAMCG